MIGHKKLPSHETHIQEVVTKGYPSTQMCRMINVADGYMCVLWCLQDQHKERSMLIRV